MRWANAFHLLSSPYTRMILASSSSGHVLITSCAVLPLLGSMRMSNGLSGFKKLNPLSSESSCMEETPRSSKIPSTPPSIVKCCFIRRKSSCTKRISGLLHAPCASRRSATDSKRSMARSNSHWSRSNPTNRSNSSCAWITSDACPPAPNVPSTKLRISFPRNTSSTASESTGTCLVAHATRVLRVQQKRRIAMHHANGVARKGRQRWGTAASACNKCSHGPWTGWTMDKRR
mmetsp:Transcript_1878/g.11277  ORF Transcript_1878/g.11277 Transcript_1878/m.11277 type:complete len:232 (-) Transcript_1878:3024-3719(-)